jgi:hypothetical protein
MARITGFTIGEMRGKMGGLVFARNRRGAYVRSYATPTNPNTEAQSLSRNSFTSAVGGWHTLNDVQKNLWMDYATNYFSSKRLGNISGGHSGINAFISLRNTLLNTQRKALATVDVDIDVNGTPVTVITQGTTILPTIPPTQPFQPILMSGQYAIDSVGAFTIDTNLEGTATFNLVYTGGSGPIPTPPTPSDDNLFEDNNGSNLGVAIYASNPLAQASQFVQNPDLVLLSSTGLISGYTTTPAVPSAFTVNFDGGVSTAIQRTQWLEGQFVRLDAWLYNSYGESARIGTSIVNVTAP